MKSLAYLWNREQKELLSDMINNQMNSVLIKVCAMGLDKIDLMKSISEMKEKLFKLEQNNYLNVCGEGGEFESLTLDCPLYKKRINM
jgi:diphthine-ammonia ligase